MQPLIKNLKKIFRLLAGQTPFFMLLKWTVRLKTHAADIRGNNDLHVAAMTLRYGEIST